MAAPPAVSVSDIPRREYGVYFVLSELFLGILLIHWCMQVSVLTVSSLVYLYNIMFLSIAATISRGKVITIGVLVFGIALIWPPLLLLLT